MVSDIDPCRRGAAHRNRRTVPRGRRAHAGTGTGPPGGRGWNQHRGLANMSISAVNSTLVRESGYINGRWCQAASGATISVFNPANGDMLGRVPDMGVDDTKAAIDAA